MRLRIHLSFTAALAVAQPLQSQNAPASGRAFTPADWYRVAQVGSPAMSPDGKFVAMQVTRVVEAENRRMSEIWVATTDGGEPIRFSAPGMHSTAPRFSADSRTLIFSGSRPGTTNTQWAVRMDRAGGEYPYVAPPAAGAAPTPQGSMPANRSFVITTGGVPGVAAAPPAGGRGGRQGGAPPQDQGGRQGGGGRAGAPADPYTPMPPMARPPANAVTLPLDPTRFDGMHVTDARYKANGQGFVPSTGRGGAPAGRGGGQGAPGGRGAGGAGGGGGGGTAPVAPAAQIFIDRLDGKGRVAVTSTNYSHRNAVVSPDGRWVAFLADTALRSDSAVAALPAPPPLPAIRDTAASQVQGPAVNTSDIFIIPVSGGAPRRIRSPGNEGSVTWSPDSRWITYTANKGRNTSTALYLVDAQRATVTEVTQGSRFELGAVRWTPRNEALVEMTIGGRHVVQLLQPRTGQLVDAIAGRRRVSGLTFDSAMTKVAYVSTTVDRPTELFLADIDGRNERKISSFNDALNEEIAWSPAEQFIYKSVGDVEIEAWLMKPYGYEPGRKYPVVLYIHGGPHSAYGEGWFDEFQNIAGAGMFVLFTNPRGSSGFGPQFSNMIRGRWGDEDYMDIMKATDIVAARPDVDSTRMGVTGGSYGGFMTAWITTKTNRFKAAQTDRMIVNWVSWYGISDAQSLTEGEFFGRPWENWDLYVDLSPIKYADKVATPTLIVQSEEDHRTPMADAEQWYMALQKHNVPVEFVRYPRSNHDLSRTGEPWLLTDRLNRLRQWFAYWLKDEGATRAVANPSGNGG